MFAKPFGDSYILYTEVKGVIIDKELFTDKKKALKVAETFMKDQQKHDVIKYGYLIIDVNQKQTFVSKGENKNCFNQAYQSDYLIKTKHNNKDTLRQQSLSSQETELKALSNDE